MRHRLVLQQQTATPDTAGGLPNTWTEWATVWAFISPLTGQERVASQQVNAQLSHKITIRYRPGVDPRMRAVYNGRVFDIQAVLNVDERNREITLLAIERLSDGNPNG